MLANMPQNSPLPRRRRLRSILHLVYHLINLLKNRLLNHKHHMPKEAQIQDLDVQATSIQVLVVVRAIKETLV